jgi:hypothetical protein
LRGLDIVLLTALGAPSEQDNQRVTIPAEIEPIAWPEVDAVLEDATSNALCIREIAGFHPGEDPGDPRASLTIETVEPSRKGAGIRLIRVLDDLHVL